MSTLTLMSTNLKVSLTKQFSASLSKVINQFTKQQCALENGQQNTDGSEEQCLQWGLSPINSFTINYQDTGYFGNKHLSNGLCI